MRDPNRQKKWTRSRCLALLLAMLMLCQVLLAGCGGRPTAEDKDAPAAETHAASNHQKPGGQDAEADKNKEEPDSPEEEGTAPTEAATTPAEETEPMEEAVGSFSKGILLKLNKKLEDLQRRPPVTMPAEGTEAEAVQLDEVQLAMAMECIKTDAVNQTLTTDANAWIWDDFLLLFENRERIQDDNAAFLELDMSGLAKRNDENMLAMESLFVEAVNEVTAAITAQRPIQDFPAVQNYNDAAGLVKLAELNGLILEWKELSEGPILELKDTKDPELNMRLENAKAELADIQNAFAGILDMGKTELQLSAEIAETAERLEELRKEIREIRFRNGTLEVFDTVEKHDDALQSLRGDLKDLEEEVQTADEDLRLRSVFGFIGLAVAFVALVLGILAIIFAVRKKAAAPAADAVSRTDLDAVSQQCKVYYDNQQLKEKKVDELGSECRRLKGMCEELQEKVRKLETNAVPAAPAPIPSAAAQPAPELPVGKLHLTYYPIAPDNSYLSADSAGQYAYYRDGRMELAKSEMNKGNTLGGWKNNGMMYLFDFEVNGTVYSADSGAMPDGFYHCGEVLRMAEIAAASGGTYKLARKGCIRMQRL